MNSASGKVNHGQVQIQSESPIRKKQPVSFDSSYNNGGYAPSLCSYCGRHKVMNTVASKLNALMKVYPAYMAEDKDLIIDVLLDKIKNANSDIDMIGNVNIYRNHLENIAENYPQANDGYWYVFTPRYRMSIDSSKPNRIAKCGYWETTGVEDVIYDDEGTKIGVEELLVYYDGHPPNGTKTNWSMAEYVAERNQHQWFIKDDKMKVDYVLCKISKEEEPEENEYKDWLKLGLA